MKNHKTLLLSNLSAFVFAILLFACAEDETLQPPDRYFPDARGTFDAFWGGLNSSYAFWDIDTTRWDEAYFYREAISDTTSELTLFGLFTEMTRGLIDGHYSINSTIDGDTIEWSPAFERILAEGAPLHLPLLEDPLAYADKMLEAYDTLPQSIGFYGTVKASRIQYFRLNTFAFSASGSLDRSRLLHAMDFIRNAPANSQGMIVDLRSNGGGDASDLSTFVNLFLPQNTRWGSIRTRRGPNRFAFGPWRDFTIAGAAKPYTKPVVVLVDRYSVSMAEITTMALALRSNTTVIGQRTFGAQGPRLDEPVDLTLGGSFTLPNGWKVTLADQATRYIDGKIYEGVGFPPNVEIEFDAARYRATGRDNQLEAAIARFR